MEANLHSRDSHGQGALGLLDSVASTQRSIWTSVSVTGRGLPRVFLCFFAQFGGPVLAPMMSWAASHFGLCGILCGTSVTCLLRTWQKALPKSWARDLLEEGG